LSLAGPETDFEGTFHHLIALFCTVAGKAHRTRGCPPNFGNEINNLGATLQPTKRQKLLKKKNLRKPMKVTSQG
jgi:hypothetical protein